MKMLSLDASSTADLIQIVMIHLASHAIKKERSDQDAQLLTTNDPRANEGHLPPPPFARGSNAGLSGERLGDGRIIARPTSTTISGMGTTRRMSRCIA